MTIGYLADAFDLLNVRDLDLIAQARRRCDRLVVGVFSDEYAEQLHGRRPVVPAVERSAMVRHVRGVTEVRLHDASGAQGPALTYHVTFVAADSPAQEALSGAVVLTPQRESESAILRNALARVQSEAVA